jgi:hypothetical protein
MSVLVCEVLAGPALGELQFNMKCRQNPVEVDSCINMAAVTRVSR